MTSAPDPIPTRSPSLMVAADSCLLTAGVFAAATGAGFALEATGVGPEGLWGTFSLLCFAVGPGLTWWLYGRRFSVRTVVGALVGYPLGGFVVWGLTMVGGFGQFLGKRIAGSEYGGAMVWLVIVTVAFLGLVAWLVVQAVRDLSPELRANVPLDVARLAATLCIVGLAAGIALYVLANPGSEVVEAIAFLLASAVIGAVVVAVAHFAERMAPPAAEAVQKQS